MSTAAASTTASATASGASTKPEARALAKAGAGAPAARPDAGDMAVLAWTDARVTLLARLWKDGMSASRIAAELGGGVSRNAVIGKVHRLGLSGRARQGDAAPEPAARTALPAPTAAAASKAKAEPAAARAETPPPATPRPAPLAPAAPPRSAEAPAAEPLRPTSKPRLATVDGERLERPAEPAKAAPAAPASAPVSTRVEAAPAAARAAVRARGNAVLAPQPIVHAAAPVASVAPAGAPAVAAGAQPAEIVVPMSQRVTIMELRENMCRWPLGDPTSPDFRYCGARTEPGVSYCPHHCGIAFQPSMERRRVR